MSPDGRSLLLGKQTGARTLRIWRVPSDERPQEELLRLAWVLSGRQMDTSSGLELLEPDALSTELAACCSEAPAFFTRSEAERQTWHRRQARLYQDRGALFAASWHLDRLLAETPNDPQLLYERGCLDAAGFQWNEALALFTRAVERRPDYWQAWYERARVAEKLSRWDEALAAYSRVLALRPDLAPVWQRRASLHVWLGHGDQAIADYSSALKKGRP
jgi:tetratricopeptide (TPR) repeat protein